MEDVPLWPARELLGAPNTDGGCISCTKQLFAYDGIFGCHNDTKSCVQTMFCPCYTVYKNTEYVNQDGLVAGGAWLALTAVHPSLGSIVPALYRGRIRSKVTNRPEEKRQIKDVAVHCLCPLFAQCQEARLIKQAQFVKMSAPQTEMMTEGLR
jgi:Cys-rich protein (TIGR01571 family)